MLITKTNPVGLDWYIQNLQTKIHGDLLTDWGILTSTYKSYGRCYRNKTENGYIPEVFTGTKDYKEVLWDDTLTAISFFGVGGTIVKKVMSEADVHFIMFANLDKLALKTNGTLITHRADEEMRKSVVDIIGRYSMGFTLISVETYIQNVLKEYTGSLNSTLAQKGDMMPVHCFRINLKLIYNPNKIC